MQRAFHTVHRASWIVTVGCLLIPALLQASSLPVFSYGRWQPAMAIQLSGMRWSDRGDIHRLESLAAHPALAMGFADVYAIIGLGRYRLTTGVTGGPAMADRLVPLFGAGLTVKLPDAWWRGFRVFANLEMHMSRPESRFKEPLPDQGADLIRHLHTQLTFLQLEGALYLAGRFGRLEVYLGGHAVQRRIRETTRVYLDQSGSIRHIGTRESPYRDSFALLPSLTLVLRLPAAHQAALQVKGVTGDVTVAVALSQTGWIVD